MVKLHENQTGTFLRVQPSKPTSETLQNYQGIGVPDESVAVILQRGRDELLLSKADDRFDDSLNRAQYAALLVSAFSPIPKVQATNFIDVSASFWARSAIEGASRRGFCRGFRGRSSARIRI